MLAYEIGDLGSNLFFRKERNSGQWYSGRFRRLWSEVQIRSMQNLYNNKKTKRKKKRQGMGQFKKGNSLN